jgi:hypothetical protein
MISDRARATGDGRADPAAEPRNRAGFDGGSRGVHKVIVSLLYGRPVIWQPLGWLGVGRSKCLERYGMASFSATP